MSESDSFIDEVTEELRRDRMYALVKRYGWIAIALVILLVGGAAFSEWRKAQATARAQAFGDQVLAAIEANDTPQARLKALADVAPSEPDGQALLELLRAGEEANAGEMAAAAERLRVLAARQDISAPYRDAAGFKSLLLTAEGDRDQRRAGLAAFAMPGNPYRLLAEEQLTLMDVEDGATETARERLTALLSDAEITAQQRVRVVQLLLSLGVDPEIALAQGESGETAQGRP